MDGMKILKAVVLALIVLVSCKDDEIAPQNQIQITSPEFVDGLLLVNTNNFQIETKEPATFASRDPFIQISSSGLIQRITSAEVVAIDVVLKSDPNIKMKLYVLGVKDDNYDKPNVDYNGPAATDADAYDSYLKGWKTLQELPKENETYAMILRHADADQGRDYSLDHTDEGPTEWWKSCDSELARQLNEAGKLRSRELGTILKDLNFPIARIISSEFCRAKETATLMNMGPSIITDGRINNLNYNVADLGGLFPGMLQLMNEQPVDGKMTLLVSHHPMNELGDLDVPTFPKVIPFAWTGAYFIKISSDKTITFEGAVSFGMFKYWRDRKLGKLGSDVLLN
jgi:phosphohistidine phosphatase SixA